MLNDETVASERKRDQFAGCLLGQALGDAVGFLVEGQSPATCAQYVNSAVRPEKLTGRYRRHFPMGQYSDDTQLAREFVLSCLACSGFNPADYGRRIAAIFTEDRIVGRGRATEEAAFRIAAGIPWDQSGTPPPAAGNGSAMRAAPVGLLYAHDQASLIKTAHDQGRITHQDPRSSAGAIAIAGATAIALQQPELNATSLCAQLSQWTRPFDPVLANAIQQLPNWIQQQPERIASTIASIGILPDQTNHWQGISPFVTPSVLWSLYSVLRSPGDYWEAICTAIAVGGDVDTTAAMTGAIAGAAVGLSRLPRELVHCVTDQGEWEFAALVDLSKKLHELHLKIRSNG